MQFKKKKIFIGILIFSIFSLLLFSGCNSTSTDPTEKKDQTDAQKTKESYISDSDYEKETGNGSFYTTVTLADNQTTYDGNGVTVEGNKIYLTQKRTYILQGTLTNGKIYINVNEQVHIILNGVNITCNDSAPISIFGKKKKVITLADGTNNFITDASNYTVFYNDDNDEPNGAIFCKNALTFNGEGNLSIKGNYNNGISCKDALKFLGGNFSISAKKNAVKGNSCVIIKEGKINITSCSSGIKSDSETAEEGFVYLDGGETSITSKKDGIQSYNDTSIKSGTINIKAGGGANSTKKVDKDKDSYKGIKSKNNFIMESGNLNIDSLDDCINCNKEASLSGGVINLTTSAPTIANKNNHYHSKGINADSSLKVSGATINISSCYEGMQSKVIEVTKGNISIKSADDGMNAAEKIEVDRVNADLYEQAERKQAKECSITIKGGTVKIDANGDGIDSNGNIYFQGGTSYINGSADEENSALDCGDYSNFISVTGGTLIACGFVPVIPSEYESTQCVVSYSPSVTITNKTFNISNSQNENILTYKTEKSWKNIIVSSPKLMKKNTYTFSIKELSNKTATQSLNGFITKITK